MANVKISNLSAVWTSSLTEHDGIKMTVTDSASSGSSKLINLLVGASSKFSVRKDSVVSAESFVGGFTGSHEGTSSRSVSSSYSVVSSNAVSSSFSVSSSFASNSTTASHSVTGLSSSYSSYSGLSNTSTTASYANNSSTASYALNGGSGGVTSGSSYNITASWSVSASYALNGGSGGVASGSSYNITSSWAISSISASYSVSSSKAISSSYAVSASYVVTASHVVSASFSNFATTSSNVVSASYARSSSHAVTASFAERYAPYWPSNVEITGSGLYPGSGNYLGTFFVATSASFTLIASALGNQPQYYRWYINSSSLLQSGSSNSFLVTQSLKISNSGYYTCNVTNSYGSSTSQNFLVQVLDPPVITAENPPNPTPPINSVATFNVAATGDLLEYIWRRTSTTSFMVDGVPNVFTNGSTTPTFTIQSLASVPPAGTEGSYACLVSNPVSPLSDITGDTPISSSEMVIYTSAPSIVNQPIDLNGQGVTSITATGSAISYSWEYGGVGITNQTSHTMSLAPAVVGGYLTQAMLDTNDDFRCRVYNGVGQVISNTFKIIPFKLTDTPTAGTGEVARAHSPHVISCDAQMVRPVGTTFNWTKNGIAVGSDVGAHGQTLPTLTLYNVQPGDAGTYICSCSYNGSSSMSDSVVVTVTPSTTNHNSTFSPLYIFPDETVTLIDDHYYNPDSYFGTTGGAGSYKMSSGWRNVAFGSSSFDTQTYEAYVPCPGTIDFSLVADTIKPSSYDLVGSVIPGNSTVWLYQYIYGSTGSACPPSVAALPDPFAYVNLDLATGAPPWTSYGAANQAVITTFKRPLPTISVEMPVSTSVTLGDSVSLEVTTTGEALEYRWYKNGVWRPAATGDTYTIDSAGYGDSGSYVCIVGSRSTHSNRTVTSTTARLDVSPP